MTFLSMNAARNGVYIDMHIDMCTGMCTGMLCTGMYTDIFLVSMCIDTTCKDGAASADAASEDDELGLVFLGGLQRDRDTGIQRYRDTARQVQGCKVTEVWRGVC